MCRRTPSIIIQLPVLLLLSMGVLTACLEKPDVRESDKYSCKSDEQCLPGFQCDQTRDRCVEKGTLTDTVDTTTDAAAEDTLPDGGDVGELKENGQVCSSDEECDSERCRGGDENLPDELGGKTTYCVSWEEYEYECAVSDGGQIWPLVQDEGACHMQTETSYVCTTTNTFEEITCSRACSDGCNEEGDGKCINPIADGEKCNVRRGTCQKGRCIFDPPDQDTWGWSPHVEGLDHAFRWPADTGQSQCYDNTGTMSCPGGVGHQTCSDGAAYCGQDAQYGLDLQTIPDWSAENRFDTTDGYTTDRWTGLKWFAALKGNWKDAEQHCSGTSVGDMEWRLPHVVELASLLSYGGTGDVFSAFSAVTADLYWSSTPSLGVGAFYWAVDFSDGRIGDANNISRLSVMCVSGSWTEATGERFHIGTKDTHQVIFDTRTGLTWEQTDPDWTGTWEEALARCEALEHAGMTSWRVPSIVELVHVVHFEDSPSANIFETGAGKYVWSSTTAPHKPLQAMRLELSSGFSDYAVKTYTGANSVRCVTSELSRP